MIFICLIFFLLFFCLIGLAIWDPHLKREAIIFTEKSPQTRLHSCIGAIIEEGLVCHTVTYDLRCPPLDLWLTVLTRPDDDGASGRQRRVFIKEVEGSEEEAHSVAGRCRVGDVLRVRHMQETNCHPGNQVLQTGHNGCFYLFKSVNRRKCQCFYSWSARLYLIDYVLIVADVVLKGHHRLPGVVLGVNAAAGGFTIFMTSHSQRIPAEKQFTFRSLFYITCHSDSCKINNQFSDNISSLSSWELFNIVCCLGFPYLMIKDLLPKQYKAHSGAFKRIAFSLDRSSGDCLLQIYWPPALTWFQTTP